ncbi:MAG: ATP-binding protein [Deltaproteobacteria bacterium]|nr:ATP-binding protein [Deltaproteobacteria bacterium]
MSQFPTEMRVPATLASLQTLLEFVTSCAERRGVGQARIREIELVMEEILVNIFNYAYPERPGDVEMVCRLDNTGGLVVEIADEGIPFNILNQKDPDREAGIEARTVGGLGIFFVKRLIRDIRYRREGGRNILTLTVDPAPAPP